MMFMMMVVMTVFIMTVLCIMVRFIIVVMFVMMFFMVMVMMMLFTFIVFVFIFIGFVKFCNPAGTCINFFKIKLVSSENLCNINVCLCSFYYTRIRLKLFYDRTDFFKLFFIYKI